MEQVPGLSSSGHVLVADDDEHLCQLIEALLVSEGYHVRIVHTGRDCLDIARTRWPDLILMDVLMPQLDGFQATEMLKNDAATRHIPVVIITSLGDRASRMTGLKGGAEDFLTKPIDHAELLARVRNLLQLKAYHDFLGRHNQILNEQVRQKTAELRGSYLETVFTLTRLTEHRDCETGSHIRRVSFYTRTLAETLGMDAVFADAIFYASPMHDIGKVAIPDRILLKPGPLDAAERAIMETHAAIGADLLRNCTSPYLRLGADIALCHHERYDGTGYPRGLRGEDIPIAGRIMIVCDQYDALRSPRPYKPGLSHDTTLDIMIHGDGRTRPEHFDPRIFAAFLDCSEVFRQIYSAHQDIIHVSPP